MKLPETPLNWAILSLLKEWNNQENAQNYKIHRLRPLFRMVAGALALEAIEEVDTEQLELPLDIELPLEMQEVDDDSAG